VEDAQNRVTAIDRARITIVDDSRHARDAGTNRIADLVTIAGIAIGAGSTRRQRGMMHTGRWIAGVGCARISVVNHRRRTGHALASAVASLQAVAGVAVRARSAGRQWHMMHTGRWVAGVSRTRVAVIDNWSRATDARPGAIANAAAVACITAAAGRAGNHRPVLASATRAGIRRARISIIA
jgi:hypothetical protein